MKQIVCTFLFALLILSCKKKNDDPAPSAPPTTSNASFAFLKDNNTWNYNYDYIISDGTFKIQLDSIGNNLYKVFNTFDAEDPYISYWFASGPYLKVYLDGSTAADAEIIYKYNPSINDNWSFTEKANNHTTYYKVVNTDTTIIASAGTFTHCKKIEVTFSYAINTQYNYWSESAGLVYQEGFLSEDLTSKNFRQISSEHGYSRW